MIGIRFTFVAVAFLSLGTMALVGCNNAAPPQPVTPSTSSLSGVNERAIASSLGTTLARPAGGAFKLADFEGKVLIVDFWATWCPPCLKQAPELAKLSERYRGQGVEIVGLTLDEPKDETEVLSFMKRTGMTYAVGYADRNLSNAFLTGSEDETGLPPIPQLFVFGKDGRLVERLIGYNESHGLAALDRIVAEQLSQ